MPSLSKMTTGAFGVTSINAVVNFYVDKSNEVFLLGGDVGRAKEKGQKARWELAHATMSISMHW